ncbi:unnamed protein product, partial [marine sediment metagenome]
MSEREYMADTYQGINIWYNEAIKKPGTDEYGAYSFHWGSTRYDHGTLPSAQAHIDSLMRGKEEEDTETETEIDEETTEEIPVEPEEPEFVFTVGGVTSFWYSGILEWFGLLTKAVVDYFAPLLLPIGRIPAYLKDIPKNIVEGSIE